MRSLAQLLHGACGSSLFAATWLLLLTACAGTETGNPPAATEVDVLPTEMWQGPPYFDSEVLADAARLGSATMTFARVEALPEGTCEALASNPGAPVAGAISLEMDAELGFDLPAGRYCGVRLFPQLASAEDAAVPPLLVGHSLLFELRDLEGASYVRVRSQRVAPFLLLVGGTDSSAAFEVPAEGLHVRLAVDAASALIALEFWETTPQADGSFLFDEANAAAFLRAFEAYPGLLRIYSAGVRSAAGDAGTPSAGYTPEDELVRTP
jgi:hypothetical protein